MSMIPENNSEYTKKKFEVGESGDIYFKNESSSNSTFKNVLLSTGLVASLALGGIGLYSLGSNSTSKNSNSINSIYTTSSLKKYRKLKSKTILSSEYSNTSQSKKNLKSKPIKEINLLNITSLENNTTNFQKKKRDSNTSLETVILSDKNKSNDSNSTILKDRIKPKKKQSYVKGYDTISVYTPNQYEQVKYDGDKYNLINYANKPLKLKIKNSNYTLEDISNLIVKKWKDSKGLFSLSSMNQINNYTLNYDNKNQYNKNHLTLFSIISHDSGNENNGFSKSIKTNYKSSNILPRNTFDLDNIFIYIDPIGKNNPENSFKINSSNLSI